MTTDSFSTLQPLATVRGPIGLFHSLPALEAAGMKTWDSRLSGVTETEEFRAQSKAMDAYREAMDKIQAIAKEKLIEAGKAELSALPEDAPLEDAARAIYRKNGIDIGQRGEGVRHGAQVSGRGVKRGVGDHGDFLCCHWINTLRLRGRGDCRHRAGHVAGKPALRSASLSASTAAPVASFTFACATCSSLALARSVSTSGLGFRLPMASGTLCLM